MGPLGVAWDHMEEALVGAGAGVDFGTVSAVTGLGWIEALPGVSGVSEVGFGEAPHATTKKTAERPRANANRMPPGVAGFPPFG